MQQELGNSEAVQQDFVRLSQSLQVWTILLFLFLLWLRKVVIWTDGIGKNPGGWFMCTLARWRRYRKMSQL